MKGSLFLFLLKKKLLLIIMAGLCIPVMAVDTDKYPDPVLVNKKINELQENSGGMVKVRNLAVSPGGTDILLIEISSTNAGKKPAVFVVGNLSGISPLSTEAALSLAERISADSSLCSTVTWFILPMGNPDAYKRFFSKPLYKDTGNSTPFNEDIDDQTDEDGYNDLDGNGIITMMRVKSPDGTFIPVAGNERLMRKADPAKGEKGIYKLYTEGTDDDGDGQYNEDCAGGTNVNINFPHLFKNFGSRSGLFPGSAPEAKAILKFSFDHPEIAMVFAFGSTNFLLVPPQGGRKSSVDMDKITIPEDIAKEMGFDSKRTYTMAEIMEAVQPMLPPGMVVDEGMIASFLGLGAIVNPMQEDLIFYNKISEEYKEYLKVKRISEERLDPAPAEDGSFELWSYYQLGVPVFSMDLWALPKPREEGKESSGITAESIEKMTNEEFIALGEDKINSFLKEKGAPEQYNAKMITGMLKDGKLNTKQLSGMLKQMPVQQTDKQKGDPKEIAQLAFSDKWVGGKDFVDWKPFAHPTLGEVEIGGFVPFSDNTPPPSMIDSLLDIHVPYIFELVKKLPKLQITDTKVTEKGAGIYQVEAWISNEGFLPFPTAMGKRNKIPVPAILTINGNGIELLSGKKRTPVNDVGAQKSVKYIWLIRLPKKSSVTLKLESKQAGNDTEEINIEG